MASFRSYPPQPPPPSNQNPPPPLPGDGSGQRRGFSSQPPLPLPFPQTFQPNSNHHYRPPPPQQQQAYPYQPPQAPPQPYPAAPPPIPPSGSQYYPASQYSQYHNSVQPPTMPPPGQPPPPSSPPPPLPPSVPPPSVPPPQPPSSSSQPHHQSRDNRSSNNHGQHEHHRGGPRDSSGSGLHDQSRHHSKHGLLPKQQHKSSAPPQPTSQWPGGRVETEEERRIRKKREYEKQRQEEKHRHQAKESQSSAMHKAHIMASGAKGHGSIVGSRMGAGKSTPFLNAERIENRLKKPTTFICKLKFRNELPDPTAQPKLMLLNTNKDLYTKYTITSLEKMHKPKLFVEPDLGIPLDLLDISVYNPPDTKQTLAPEDKELLRDAELATPIKQDGIKRKERPTDKGLSWLVKTEYISPISMEAAKTSLSEKQAKDLREIKGGRQILDNNTNNREKQIQAITASFEACKSRPVHATNKRLQPVEIMPLLPDFDRGSDKFVMATFDGEPTADSEVFNKLDKITREEHESQAIMKSFTGSGSDPAKPDRFLAYMAPSPDELWKDVYEETEDISYSWVREYQWDVRGDDAEDHATYIVALGEETAHYLPLPTKLVLRKKRAKDGRSNTEVEHYPVPASVTVRNRPEVSAKELKDSGDYTNSKGNYSSSKRGRSGNGDNLETRHHKSTRVHETDNYSGGEDEMSD